jgi:uncharacterized protein (DUF697 family)/tellurite resistance protein
MTESDREPIVTIALLAALADGQATPHEMTQLEQALARLGVTDLEAIPDRVAAGQVQLADVARGLSPGNDARQLAYEIAVVVCNSDGVANEKETRFLADLRVALGLDASSVAAVEQRAAAVAGAPVTAPAQVGSGAQPPVAGLDDFILHQAVIAGALELLPEGLANIAILPVQLRMVYHIGQRYGQQLDANQIKDLAGTLGIGAAAQVVEGAVRKLLGGLTKRLFGGLIGGATGMAAGAAVTFGTTYALGHVAQQYYAQGRRLSTEDLRALFARFQEEARALFPKVHDQVQAQARSLDLQSLLGSHG